MKMLIGGKWVDKKKKIDILNPYDNSLEDTVPYGTIDDIEKAIAIAQKGYEINRNYLLIKEYQFLRKRPISCKFVMKN